MELNKIDKIVIGSLILIFVIGGFGKGAILTIIPFAFIYYIMRDNILKVFGFTDIHSTNGIGLHETKDSKLEEDFDEELEFNDKKVKKNEENE